MGDYPRRDLESALLRKGFRCSNNDHRKFVYYSCNGKKTSVWTKTSRGSKHKSISESNLRKMARQCRLDYQDFLRLVECPMSRDEFEELLVQNGTIR